MEKTFGSSKYTPRPVINYFEFCGVRVSYPNEHEVLSCEKIHNWGVKVEFKLLDSHPEIKRRGDIMTFTRDFKEYGFHSQEEAIVHFYNLLNKVNPQKDYLLYCIAVILVCMWGFGYFIFENHNPIIHLLLAIAGIAVLLQIIKNSDTNG